VNPYAMFLYALSSPVTREIFHKAEIFFARIRITDHDSDNNHIEELCSTCVEKVAKIQIGINREQRQLLSSNSDNVSSYAILYGNIVQLEED
jgi:hypothetical protein